MNTECLTVLTTASGILALLLLAPLAVSWGARFAIWASGRQGRDKAQQTPDEQ